MTITITETHPFLILVWVGGNGKLSSLFERGRWVEQARCQSQQSAEEVALCLSLRHPAGVQIATQIRDRRGTRLQPCRYYPASAQALCSHPGGRDR